MDEIWNLIKSVSEGFPTYSYTFDSFQFFGETLASKG